MSKYLDDLERENDELRALLREATFEVCFPYCSSQTEEKWASPEKCGDCWAKKLVAALKKKRAPETILVLNTRRFDDGRASLLPTVTLNNDVIRTLSPDEIKGAKFALERAINQIEEIRAKTAKISQKPF